MPCQRAIEPSGDGRARAIARSGKGFTATDWARVGWSELASQPLPDRAIARCPAIARSPDRRSPI